MVKTLIWSVTLYCAEIRTMRKEDITMLEAFEMKVWLRMEKIRWTEHISNEVLKLVEEERFLLTIIRTRQRNWMGHVMTEDSLPREIIEGRMDCKWGRRRPRKKLLDWMSEEYNKLKKKLNIEKHETIGGLDQPEGREIKEVTENSKKITTQQQWYRRRAEKLSAAAAAARRSTKVGGDA